MDIRITLIIILIISMFILIFILATGKYEKNKNQSTHTSYILGTLINLKAIGTKSEEAISEAIERLNNLDDKMSAFKEESEICKINSTSGVDFQVVSDDIFKVIKSALKYSEILEGTFDPTIRPLVKLWNIGKGENKIPNESEITSALKLVNYKSVILDEFNKSIMLKNKNQELDIGGIVKGFAADEVRDIFNKLNIKSGLIDLGGNIFAVGSKLDGDSWNIGIQDPFKNRGEYIGVLSLRNKSVVTSGNYERYFIEKNKIFHHILDPKTGYPSESEIISASIISDDSIKGDGLSTGIYILGIEKSMKIIEEIDGIEAILITKNKEVYLTSGIKDNFELTQDEFKLIKFSVTKEKY